MAQLIVSHFLNFGLLLYICYELLLTNIHAPNCHLALMHVSPMTATSSSFVNTHGGPCFLDMVFSLKWFDNEINSLYFRTKSTFFIDVILISIVSIAFFKAFIVDLPFKLIVGLLFVFSNFWPIFCASYSGKIILISSWLVQLCHIFFARHIEYHGWFDPPSFSFH